MSNITYISDPLEVSMHDDWFEIADTNHFWMKWRFREIIKKLKHADEPLKVLEVGCGSGTVMSQFHTEKNMSIDGCDLNVFALGMVPPMDSKVYCYNIFDKHPDILKQKYNCIFLLDVIEHIDDDVAFIEACKDHLELDGKVVINVPAYMHLYSKYDTEVGHVRRYNKSKLNASIENAGMETVKINYWGAFLYPIGVLRKFWINSKKENIIQNGMKPQNKLVEFVLNTIMRLETILPFHFPFGTSLIAIANKK